MKKFKKFAKSYGVLAVSLIFLAGVASADFGFMDKVAQVAGQIFGQNLVEKVNVDELSFGAMPGDALPGPEFKIGAITYYVKDQTMNLASSTICQLRAPATASSTLIFGQAKFGHASTTGTVRVQIAKSASTNNTATTTSLGATDMTANISGIVNATTTAVDAIDDKTVFGPNEWFTVGLRGTTNYTTEHPSGTCKAVWIY